METDVDVGLLLPLDKLHVIMASRRLASATGGQSWHVSQSRITRHFTHGKFHEFDTLKAHCCSVIYSACMLYLAWEEVTWGNNILLNA